MVYIAESLQILFYKKGNELVSKPITTDKHSLSLIRKYSQEAPEVIKSFFSISMWSADGWHWINTPEEKYYFQIRSWMVCNIKHKWGMYYFHRKKEDRFLFCFDDKRDALLFTLRWHHVLRLRVDSY